MKIDKAIEILALYYREVNIDPPLHFNDALKIGIEAMERVKEIRRRGYDYYGYNLPSETVESDTELK